MSYIESEAAKKAYCQICFENSICYRNPETCQDLKAFDAIPAADMRPVVLCRDCRSYNKPRLGFCETHLVRMHGDDYCSYSKKREDDDG